MCRFTLSTLVQAQYNVYNDLEEAESRILLPSKEKEFPVFEMDVAASASTPQADLLPECVGLDQVTVLSGTLQRRTHTTC